MRIKNLRLMVGMGTFLWLLRQLFPIDVFIAVQSSVKKRDCTHRRSVSDGYCEVDRTIRGYDVGGVHNIICIFLWEFFS